MDASVANSIITGAVAVAVAVIGWYTAKSRKRDEARRQLDECMMGMMAANSDGLLIVLKHLRGEQLNGDVEKAIVAIEREREEYSQARDHIAANL